MELRRRKSAARNIATLLDDLSTLTEFSPEDWTMRYEGKTQPWDEEVFANMVPLTPGAYRASHQGELNEMRSAAGLAIKPIHTLTPETRAIQSMAGIR